MDKNGDVIGDRELNLYNILVADFFPLYTAQDRSLIFCNFSVNVARKIRNFRKNLKQFIQPT